MATKAELEAELAELKRQLSEQSDMEQEAEDVLESDGSPAEELAGIGKEFEALLHELTDEAKNSPHLKLALGAAGIFVAGMIIGRMR